ncbi:hypothetical protein Hamer_G025158 [Homarus americanus]|uniref:Uncharacterized protein n=1 Tax=Homarus americanus TaxID=6706 RepID=A0A8J5TUP0_HOMAM|nr:hypothetical protein Hamer_G025158 [Homarus americanus]
MVGGEAKGDEGGGEKETGERDLRREKKDHRRGEDRPKRHHVYSSSGQGARGSDTPRGDRRHTVK